METFFITGAIVAFFGFIAITIAGKRWGKDIQLYTMIGVVFLSLLTPVLLFAQNDAVNYRLGWMIGMLIMVVLGPKSKKPKKDSSD